MEVSSSPAARRYLRQLPPESAAPTATKRAAIYIRVSTAKQVKKDLGKEGLSLPAQRQQCYAEAERRGATVIEEYIEKGETGTNTNRPELQRLVERVRVCHDLDYVIIPALDRFARLVRDDANLFHDLHEAGVELISVRENIDRTPSGMLLHWVMSAVNEFESRNNGLRTVSGMAQKAKVGGTPGRAPIGYINIRLTQDGREFRTVEIDPDRADHVRWAFTAYATGEWTIRDLTTELNQRGLKALPQGDQPERPIHYSRVAHMLNNRYYIGIVTFRGVEYDGRHESLIDPELFEQVQTVLRAHHGAAEKQRVHHHYLKGSVFCLACGTRLCITKAKGRYFYFFCLNRHRREGCKQPYLNIDAVEAIVEEHYRIVSLDPEMATQAREALAGELANRRKHSEVDAKRQNRRLNKLAEERRKLLQAHYAGAIPLELLKEEQDRIGREVTEARRFLQQAEQAFADVESTIAQALEIARNLFEAYSQGGPTVRRLLNQFFFSKVLVGTDRVEVEFSDPALALYRFALSQASEPVRRKGAQYLRQSAPSQFTDLSFLSSNVDRLVPPSKQNSKKVLVNTSSNVDCLAGQRQNSLTRHLDVVESVTSRLCALVSPPSLGR
jgi:DNA invertase Pin-like site-specific DNA recombinase